MRYTDFLTRIIDDGIAGLRGHTTLRADKQAGGIAGFEACRGKNHQQLAELLAQSRRDTESLFYEKDDVLKSDYWRRRYFSIEVEWVCNVLSSVLTATHTIVPPTGMGTLAAYDILGTDTVTDDLDSLVN